MLFNNDKLGHEGRNIDTLFLDSIENCEMSVWK